MITQELINRINELARKKKSEGLTEEEAAEQAKLRKIYLDEFRASFESQLKNIEIVDPDDPRLKQKNNNVKN